MAGTITTSLTVVAQNGLYSRTWQETPSTGFTQNGPGDVGNQVTLSSGAATTLDLGGVTTLGLCVFKNLDATNNLDVGISSAGFVAVMTLKPGEFMYFRFKAGVTPQAKAQAGSPILAYWINQD